MKDVFYTVPAARKRVGSSLQTCGPCNISRMSATNLSWSCW